MGTVGHIGWRAARAPAVDASPAVERVEQAASDNCLVSRLVYLVVALYAVVFTLLSVQQHAAFQTHAFDLGNMDQAVWNTVNGRPLEFTNWPGGTNRLAAHVEPVLFLVALVYKLFSGPVTLLVIQSCVVALGALPAYWLARGVLGHSAIAAVFAFSYLLAPAVEMANLADFHAVTMSAGFLMFAFWFAWRGGRSQMASSPARAAPMPAAPRNDRYADVCFFTFAVLAMATKEQVPLTVFGMGLYVALVQGRARTGYAACILAALWAVIAFLVVIPAFNAAGGSPYVSRYEGMALESVTDPARVEFVQQLLQPTAYLALLSPLTLATGIAELAINLLSSFPEMYWGQAHYGAVLVPVVMASAILGAGSLYRAVEPLHARAGSLALWVIGGAVMTSSLASFATQVYLPLADHPPGITEHHRRANDVLALVPREAGVSTSSTLNPHLSQRRGLYLFPDLGCCDGVRPHPFDRLRTAPDPLPGGEGTPPDTDYVAIDVTGTPYPIDAANQWYRLTQMLESGEWGVVTAADGVLLLQRDAPVTAPPPEFYTFTQARETDIGVKVERPFGVGLALAGYALEPGTRIHGRHGYARLDLFWRVWDRQASDFLVSVTLVGSDGKALLVDRHQATTLWYPPTRWEPGSLVRVTVPRLALSGAERGEVRVALVEREAPYEVIAGPVRLTEIVRG